MRTGGNSSGNFLQMQGHRLGIAGRHRQSRPGSTLRADGSEQIGVLIALIGRLARAIASPCPLINQAVLLANAGFVLEPDFYRCVGREFTGPLGDVGREVFLKASNTHASCPGACGRALT